MRPDPATTNAFLYCLAVAAQRTEVQVLFFVAMSNHYHAGVVDKAGRLPEFLEYFHKLFAKHQNALRGRWENFWAPEQTSVVQLVEPSDLMEKMMYTLLNPVAANLVAACGEWPGATSLHAQLSGAPIRVQRPSLFFRNDGPMPAQAVLDLALPPGVNPEDRGEHVRLIRERIAQEESRAAAKRAALGIQVAGVRAVLRQRWSDRPSDREPRRRLSPRIACRNSWARVEAMARNQAFLAAYRAARERLLAGLEVTFPPGTYWLRRFARLTCAPPIAA
jgi:hypothetical protein